MKSSVEKGKKRQCKSATKKVKAAKKPTKTKLAVKKSTNVKRVTGKRKRNDQHEPETKIERGETRTAQTKVVTKDKKKRKKTSA
ncbi:hypothetical protein MKW92_040826, partial [Papaver armeniacum]